MKVLEREAELAALDALLEAVRTEGRGRLVLVGGEAGVGKTSLLQHFRERAEPARVLWGSADALFTPRPLGPLVDVAEIVGGDLQQLLGDDAKPYDVATTLIRELEAEAPTVLVLEDLHWADEATLDVLRLLSRRIARVPVLVVATYRDDQLEATHPLRVVLGELSTGDLVTRIELAPLSPDAVAALATAQDVDPGELHRLTGGNPFFVSEVLAGGQAELLPATVRDAVLARAAGLSDGARAVLEAVAVAPPDVELWLLEALVGDEVDHLEECLGTGMLTSEDRGVGFRHELARLAVENSLAPNRRAALHRRALAALAQPGHRAPDLERLSDHADAAEDAEAVLRYAPAAAERAAGLGAHREAAAQYARALRFADGLEPARRADLLWHRAHACYLTDQRDEAVQALEEALEHLRRAPDARREGDALRAMSEILWCPGQVGEAEDRGRRAVAKLEELGDGSELGMAYANLASLYKDSDEPAQAELWAARAILLAENLGDVELLVHALASTGAAKAVAGLPQGIEQLSQALRLAEEHGLVEAVGRVVLIACWARVRNPLCGVPADTLDRALLYCSEHGLELYRHYALAFQARRALDEGRWDDAIASTEPVLQVRRASTIPTIHALVVTGLARARRGEPGAWAPLEEARALGEPSGELQRIAPVAAAMAEVAWLEGRPERVAELTENAFALASDHRMAWAVGELGCWRRRAGGMDGAMDGAAAPFALEISGDHAGAADLWTEIGWPYNAALALAASDDESLLRRSLEMLQGLEARPAAGIVARKLRSRGARGLPRGPRPATRRNPAQLSPRELDVLALVADGLRNAEIAERLFLSPKTVDHHVSSILGKLDVRTRAEAGAAAVKLGLPAQDR